MTLPDLDTVRDQFEDRVFADRDLTRPAACRRSSLRQRRCGSQQGHPTARLANGAGTPRTRPISVDGRFVQGELAMLKTYCPDKLPDSRTGAGTLLLSNTFGRSEDPWTCVSASRT